MLSLIQDSINSDCSFASLPITNDQLTLSSANRYKRINRFETCLHRFVDGFSRNDTWCFELDSLSRVGFNWSETIDVVAKSINDTAKKTITNWNIDNGTCAFNNVTFLDISKNNLGIP